MSSNELSEKGSESMRITMNLTRGGGQPHSRPQGANLAGRVTVQVTGISKMEMKILYIYSKSKYIIYIYIIKKIKYLYIEYQTYLLGVWELRKSCTFKTSGF